MGKAVHKRAADGSQPRLMQFGGNDSDQGDRRPADDVAENDGGNAGNDPQGRLFLKGGKVCPLIHGLADKFFLGKPLDKLSDHQHTLWQGRTAQQDV